MPLFHLMSFFFIKLKWHNCNNNSSIIMLLLADKIFECYSNRQSLFKNIQTNHATYLLIAFDTNLPHFKKWLFGQFVCTPTMPVGFFFFLTKSIRSISWLLFVFIILYIPITFFFFFETIKLYFSSWTSKHNHYTIN